MKSIRQSWSAWLLAGTLSASGGVALGQTATPTVAPKVDPYPSPVPTKCLKCPTPTPTPTKGVLPGAVTNLTVTQAMAGSVKVKVAWNAPLTGLPILSYTLKRYTNGVLDNSSTIAGTYTAWTTSCSAIGVPCGFAMQATNAVGTGKMSPTVSITLK